ncbi:tail fiber assembly protein [Pseudomonas sp. GTC 16482]|uniref:tail fiber assembly protein n=1 Tax=Pseudomonas sp. GTC 16482 TaxID=1661693 RepID=UPI000761A786|nr:tail fiber assembly protein [Pseudomonas sp. GTC 16482]
MPAEQTMPQPSQKWWTVPGVEAPQVSNYNAYTREFMGAAFADPSPLEPGVWLIPGLAVIGAAPEAKDGGVMVLQDDGRTWSEVENHRGKLVYSVETGEPTLWGQLGPIPDTHTLLAPEGAFAAWDGDEWVEDTKAMKAALVANAVNKQRLLNQLANENINRLNTAVRLGIATETEKAALLDWEVYFVLLGRLSPTQVLPAASDWPEAPNGDAAGVWLSSMGYDEIEQPAAPAEVVTGQGTAASLEQAKSAEGAPTAEGADSTVSTVSTESTESTKGTAK